MVTYNAQRMLNRKQDPQDMETIQDYRHTQARERLRDSEDYRPISLLCHTYKLYERMILNRIAPVVEQHLIKEQAGFRTGKSCTSQLLNLTQHIEDGYQRGMITGAAFVDISAAYDTVNHRILIQKLYNITFIGIKIWSYINSCISNFVSNSYNQDVFIVGCTIRELCISRGEEHCLFHMYELEEFIEFLST